MSEADAADAAATAPSETQVAAVHEETTQPSLRFRFDIDRDGNILGFQAAPALERLGWGRGLVGRRCYVALACRDLEGRPLCHLCVQMRAAPPDAAQNPRTVARLAGSGGDVVVSRSSVRRLAQRHLAIEGEV
ncbi:MAG TPA: hypothetical protein VFC31_13830 [Candidatus Limnocylindria bacterium]|nr:hypothetical protein [Candidatus Limnocylindria bacterium]